jgi:signal transduction histidine kinase
VAPPSDDELGRLDALLRYNILDTYPEACYDDLTKIAASICGTPIALVSLVDKDRQWFKSRTGLDAKETHRDLAFCAHAILQPDVFIVADTLEDERFFDNPLVTSDPSIRFYAGTPLVTYDGHALGTLCVIDRSPRQLSEDQIETLAALGRQITHLLEMRLYANRLEKMAELRDRLLAMLSHDMKDSFNVLIGFAKTLGKRAERITPEQARDMGQSIQFSAERAHQLLLALLAWSTNQMEGKGYRAEEVKLSDTCNYLVRLMADLAQQKNINLTHNCPDNILLWVNQCLLSSALQNLLSNAIKFSHANSDIQIDIQQQAHLVTLSVIDHGIGMPPELADKLFQGEMVRSRKGTSGEGGTGLGTLLVADFIDSINGNLQIDTAPEQGCKISFTLPFHH